MKSMNVKASRGEERNGPQMAASNRPNHKFNHVIAAGIETDRATPRADAAGISPVQPSEAKPAASSGPRDQVLDDNPIAFCLATLYITGQSLLQCIVYYGSCPCMNPSERRLQSWGVRGDEQSTAVQPAPPAPPARTPRTADQDDPTLWPDVHVLGGKMPNA